MNYLFSVFWKNIRIGLVYTHKNNFIYFYDQDGIKESSEFGFNKLIGFPDINKVYINKTLFPVFESRILSSKRSGKMSIEEKINFLLSPEGKLITDHINFKKEELTHVKRKF